jgi:hypothetical protein
MWLLYVRYSLSCWRWPAGRSEELGSKGYSASKDTVSDLLKMLGYGLQADKKTLTTKPPHPDRNAQFEHINDETKKAIANGNPVLSIDAKKKENIGNFTVPAGRQGNKQME